MNNNTRNSETVNVKIVSCFTSNVIGMVSCLTTLYLSKSSGCSLLVFNAHSFSSKEQLAFLDSAGEKLQRYKG